MLCLSHFIVIVARSSLAQGLILVIPLLSQRNLDDCCLESRSVNIVPFDRPLHHTLVIRASRPHLAASTTSGPDIECIRLCLAATLVCREDSSICCFTPLGLSMTVSDTYTYRQRSLRHPVKRFEHASFYIRDSTFHSAQRLTGKTEYTAKVAILIMTGENHEGEAARPKTRS